MTRRPATALRFGLHLLLAACLLLQATVTVALGTTMALANAGAPSTALAVDAVGDDMPPCHAATAPAPQPAGAAAAHGCCSDDGGLCEWVCAVSAPPLAIMRLAFALPDLPAVALEALVATTPSWPVTAPLRPPIA